MTLDPNALYYTFSTIAQTLAGAYGVIAAVVVFRIQLIANAEIVNKSLRNEYFATPEGALPGERARVVADHNATRRRHATEQKFLISGLRQSTIFVGATLATCFILLPSTPGLCRYPNAGLWTLRATVALAIFSLATFAPIMCSFGGNSSWAGGDPSMWTWMGRSWKRIRAYVEDATSEPKN